MPINETIENIIAIRGERLPKIEEAITHLKKVQDEIIKLEEQKQLINEQMRERNGNYYTLFHNNPAMEIQLNLIDVQDLKAKVHAQLERLNHLKKRFSRDAVQFAFVGYERQGKSTFLQSITGLDDRVIPAYDAGSCTGAISIIHNIPNNEKPYVVIQYYTAQEFLEKASGRYINLYGQPLNCHSLEDFRNVELEQLENLASETNRLRYQSSYIDHFGDYCQFIGHVDERIPLDEGNLNIIAECVSQYTSSGGKKTYHYKYLAVKYVNIYTHFTDQRVQNSRIVLVDTVGLGNSFDGPNAQVEMFKVLEEDCDGAVDICRPRREQSPLDDPQKRILDEIELRLKSRLPRKWFYYVLNRDTRPGVDNTVTVNNFQEVIQQTIDGQDEDKRTVAGVLNVNAANRDEVNEKLMTPLLNLISNNLVDIDNTFTSEALEAGKLLATQYGELVSAFEKLISANARQQAGWYAMYRGLFTTTFNTASTRISAIEQQYRDVRDNPCHVVSYSIEEKINRMGELMVSEKDIKNDINAGAMNHNEILVKYCKTYMNRAYDIFQEINTSVLLPLQNEMKGQIIAALFKEGRLGEIALSDYDISQGATKEWLECLISEKFKSDGYSHFRETLRFLLDYSLNIDGMIRYNVIKSLALVDPFSQEFENIQNIQGSSNDQAYRIWNTIATRIQRVQVKMREWKDDFAKIPNLSLSAQISIFRDKMFRNPEVENELDVFYNENSPVIWRDEYKKSVIGNQTCQILDGLYRELLKLQKRAAFVSIF